MNNVLHTGIRILVLAVVLTLVAGLASAGPFVSWRGGFKIDVPDRFDHMDHRKVDAHLTAIGADRSMLDYEAVFADTTGPAFPLGEYFIVAIETSDEPDPQQIDSVLRIVFYGFGKGLRYAPMTEFLTRLSSDEPSYDRDDKIASVITEVTQPDQSIKRNLMMLKFCDKGIISFFYYAPDELFESGVEQMQLIVNSFSTEDLDSAVPSEKRKVTSVRPADEPSRSRDDESSVPVAVYVGVGVVLMVVLLKRRKKTKK